MVKERVLIVGGGFAGVKAALELCHDDRFAVTLLTDDPELRYYPTLYHSATGGKRANSSIPLATIFEGKDIKVALGTAKKLIRKDKTVTTGQGIAFEYDKLILALGVVTNYFGISGLEEYSYSIKTQAEAERFKKHLHRQLEDEHKPDLHYVVVGAGPTGIELAGALPDYLRCIMKNHGIEHRAIHVDLIEAAPRLLPRMPKDTSRAVRKRLRKLGIRLYLNSTVQGETADKLMVSGKPIRSHTVVWTAGVTNHPFFKDNGFVLTGRGKVATDIYLQAEPDIYVLGDNANTPYSGMAQTALGDGKFVARNLKRHHSGWRLRSYEAKPPVTVLPCGPHWSAVVWGHLRLYGRIGWFMREAADMKGFRALESWRRATRQWYSEFTRDDVCETCAASKDL
ncbi:MAG TPA: FAD-dependent oxidoreductase [Candidatus Saccharimonadales bacterium]|nr:FAD-dependent oxidoreductase [Candidatus Saccharimonadales bacterium]